MVLKIKSRDYDDIAIFIGKPVALLITINKDKVKVTNGKETVLETNNNIQAYNKLFKTLETQEADLYFLEHFGKTVISDMDKNSFLAILRRWFEN